MLRAVIAIAPWLASAALAGCTADARAVPAQEGNDDALASRLRASLDSLGARGAFSGTVLVARGDSVLVTAAYGLANRDYDIPNSAETVYDLASMTKMLTAIAVAQLAEEGRLTLDDRLGRWVPSFPNVEAKRRVRLAHLLSHTAGIQDYPGVQEPARPSATDVLRAVERAQRPALDAEPGTRHRYCNACFGILGYVVERASGEPYQARVSRGVLAPAGMTSTRWYDVSDVIPRRAVGYWLDSAGGTVTLRNNLPRRVTTGNAETGIYSTVGDLHRLAVALQRGRLVSHAMAERLLTAKPELGAPAWGLGFAVETLPTVGRIAGHGGSGREGVSTALDMFLDAGYVAVILSNARGGRTAARAVIRDEIARAVRRGSAGRSP